MILTASTKSCTSGTAPRAPSAEAFGRYLTWTSDILAPPPGTPHGTRKALGSKYTGDPAVLDLDDPQVLMDWSLRPSSVVSRDRDSTQQWARAIYDTGQRRWPVVVVITTNPAGPALESGT
jgi:hypothetical protein